MLAFSIQQPWAHSILHFGKDVENRKWRTDFKGRVIVHAGKRFDLDGYEYLIDELPIEASLPASDAFACGVFLGTVEIYGCFPVERVESKWAFGPWCFLLRNPLAFGEPIAGKGQLGFFEPPREVIDAARALEASA